MCYLKTIDIGSRQVEWLENTIRCQYIVALGDLIAEETAGALADWTGDNADGLSYAEYFNGTADDSLIGKSALNELVRTSVFMSRTITDMRLGKALGVDGVTPDPDALLGGDGDSMVADMRNQVLGMQDVYLGGTPTPSLASAPLRGDSLKRRINGCGLRSRMPCRRLMNWKSRFVKPFRVTRRSRWMPTLR